MATKKTTKKQNAKKSVFIGATVAGAAAAAAAYYFYGPKGKRHRSKLKSWSLKAQAEVMDKIEKVKELDRDTFEGVVDQVARKYEKATNVATSEVNDFVKEAKAQWKHVESEFNKGVKKGKTAAKKAIKKTTKKATPKKKVAKKK